MLGGRDSIVDVCRGTGAGDDLVVFPLRFAVLTPHMLLARCTCSRVTGQLIGPLRSSILSSALVVSPAVFCRLRACLASVT